ncbi:MAG: hypothetical protein A3D18_04470 [Chlamydiae bacterium RIFCSPHIGHO2_02_FULL_49_29]|nr:MAG: hypothetical protein A3D18_04470 [Chlamydiae bacterium RIFCSPHIGHO2_02_FULL_49_29]
MRWTNPFISPRGPRGVVFGFYANKFFPITVLGRRRRTYVLSNGKETSKTIIDLLFFSFQLASSLSSCVTNRLLFFTYDGKETLLRLSKK